MAWGTYMLRKPVVLVFIRFGCGRGIIGGYHENSRLRNINPIVGV